MENPNKENTAREKRKKMWILMRVLCQRPQCQDFIQDEICFCFDQIIGPLKVKWVLNSKQMSQETSPGHTVLKVNPTIGTKQLFGGT